MASSDIQGQHFLFSVTPARSHPYIMLMRLDRPIGTWLLYIPCLWGMALSGFNHDWVVLLYYALLFGVGAGVMRSAGCVWNDIIDHKKDAEVERTKNRPIASGAVTPKQAMILLVILLMIGLVIVVQLPWRSLFIASSSLLLVAIYPFMKRITYWPQIWLGLTFNWGLFVGFSVFSSNIEYLAIYIIYGGAICWTLAYDTIYACQDKDDDVKINVKSTALLFGDKVRFMVGLCYILFFSAVASVIYIYYTPFNAIFLGLAIIHSLVLMRIFTGDNSNINTILFIKNRAIGLWILLALLPWHTI